MLLQIRPACPCAPTLLRTAACRAGSVPFTRYVYFITACQLCKGHFISLELFLIPAAFCPNFCLFFRRFFQFFACFFAQGAGAAAPTPQKGPAQRRCHSGSSLRLLNRIGQGADACHLVQVAGKGVDRAEAVHPAAAGDLQAALAGQAGLLGLGDVPGRFVEGALQDINLPGDLLAALCVLDGKAVCAGLRCLKGITAVKGILRGDGDPPPKRYRWNRSALR